MNDAIIELTNVTKSFGGVVANRNVSLSVPRGRITGLIGPNGSGKTTLFNSIVGYHPIDSGSIRFEGEELTSLDRNAMRLKRRDMQIVFQDPYASLDSRLPVGAIIAEPLEIHRVGDRQRRRQRVAELLSLVGLEVDAAMRYPHEFSGGQRQRIGIARAIALEPKLVVLDEPMSGLDPIGRKEVRDLILRLKESGKTVLFSSHILHDAELLCDRVAMILKGRLVASGRVSELIDQGTTYSVELVIDHLSPEGLEHLRPLTEKVVAQGDRLLAVLKHPRDVEPALSIIRAAKATLFSLTPHKRSLEDLFIGMVNGQHAGRGVQG